LGFKVFETFLVFLFVRLSRGVVVCCHYELILLAVSLLKIYSNESEFTSLHALFKHRP